jgi:uncharacterized protein YidB (DUF937 family)
MGKGLPSMMALLGLVAVAGYQNRDKIAEMLGQRGQGRPGEGAGGGLGGLLGELGDALGGGSRGGDGGILSGGLGELVERFRQNGQGEAAESWVSTGPNRQIAANELEQAIGPDVLDTLSQRTGLSREELVARLSRDLPDAVDRYTPEGRIPEEGGSYRA